MHTIEAANIQTNNEIGSEYHSGTKTNFEIIFQLRAIGSNLEIHIDLLSAAYFDIRYNSAILIADQYVLLAEHQCLLKLCMKIDKLLPYKDLVDFLRSGSSFNSCSLSILFIHKWIKDNYSNNCEQYY